MTTSNNTVKTTFHFRPNKTGSKQLAALQVAAQAAGVTLEATDTGAMRPSEVHELPTYTLEEWASRAPQFVATELQKLVEQAARKLFIDVWLPVDATALTIEAVAECLTPAPRVVLSKENLALVVASLGEIMAQAGVPSPLANAVKALVSARFSHRELIKYQDKLESVGTILARLDEAYLPLLPSELSEHGAQLMVEALRNFNGFIEALEAESEEVDLDAF